MPMPYRWRILGVFSAYFRCAFSSRMEYMRNCVFVRILAVFDKVLKNTYILAYSSVFQTY